MTDHNILPIDCVGLTTDHLSKLKIYIAGPMSGYPDGNFAAFDLKEKQLLACGWDVISPAQMDRKAGVHPDKLGEYDYQECANRDVEALMLCDAIYFMAGFQFSKGACWERALAKHQNIKRYYEIPREDHERQSGIGQ